ncbi:amidohydrolase family protein, partial [Haemophilus parainfluenzae]|uniref:amidohydrolase family protein n=1 Tax=Haemophilus parainfluenzae TaxID=729 RepID=UPI00124B6FFC
ALTLIEAVANCVRHLHLPLAEALRMASLYPARAIGVDGELGHLAPGYIANLVLLDPATLAVSGVIDGGVLQWFEEQALYPSPVTADIQ